MTRPPDAPPLLQVRGLRKRFGGVVALDGVDLTVRAGEIHALVGENGAGKSTLIQIISGVFPPDEGSIVLGGRSIHLASPGAAQHHGIAAVYQELSLVEDLDVAQNIFLGREPRVAGPIVDSARLYRECSDLLAGLGIATLDPRAPVWALAVADRQLVELARALSQQASLVIMDEPTSALPTQDEERLLQLLTTLPQRTVGVLYVTHRLDEVFRIADRVTVLRDGQVVSTKPIADTSPEDLVQSMVGRDLARHLFPERPPAQLARADRLRVEEMSSPGLVHDVSLHVGQGEVVGLAGLIGSGRTSLLRAIFGADRAATGRVWLDGEQVAVGSPRHAIALGIGMISEDRRLESLALRLTVLRNLTAVYLPGRLGVVDERAARGLGRTLADEVQLWGDLDRRVRQLSGGNQQKVALAKWLLLRPRVLLCDEPTRGIDVGAKAEIYELLRALAAEGSAILFASSELPEVLGLADRILVMFEGRLVDEFDAATADEASIVRAASGISRVSPNSHVLVSCRRPLQHSSNQDRGIADPDERSIDSGERVSHVDPVEAAEATVARVDHPHAVLPHQRDEVGVRDVVAPRVIAGGRPVERPEPIALAGRPDVRPIDQRLDVVHRIASRQRSRSPIRASARISGRAAYTARDEQTAGGGAMADTNTGGPAQPGGFDWQSVLSGKSPEMRRYRGIFKHIPRAPRCKICAAPFEGPGAPLMRALGRSRWTKNPNFCRICEVFLSQHPGGAEVELTFLFADIRGSTARAESMSASEFSTLLNRFYGVGSRVVIDHDGIVDKYVGDEIVAIFAPPFAGAAHATQAIAAARLLLTETGHATAGGPWAPIGIGVHTGLAFVGSVGEGGVTDFTALGDAVNTTSRLASAAAAGEVLVSRASATAAGLADEGLEQRHLELRGRSEPVDVLVLHAEGVAGAA